MNGGDESEGAALQIALTNMRILCTGLWCAGITPACETKGRTRECQSMQTRCHSMHECLLGPGWSRVDACAGRRVHCARSLRNARLCVHMCGDSSQSTAVMSTPLPKAAVIQAYAYCYYCRIIARSQKRAESVGQCSKLRAKEQSSKHVHSTAYAHALPPQRLQSTDYTARMCEGKARMSGHAKVRNRHAQSTAVCRSH